jgi:hypothetical protein
MRKINNISRKIIIFLIVISLKQVSFSQISSFDDLCQNPAFHDTIALIWDNYKPFIEGKIKNSQEDTYNLYDVQISTNILLKYAFNKKKYFLVDDLLNTFLKAALTLDTLQTYRFIYFYPENIPKESVMNMGKPYSMWIDGTSKINPTEEDILSSSQFLSMVSEAIFEIAMIKKTERTQTMTDFVKKYSPILDSHYERWIKGINVKNPKTGEIFTNVGPFQKRAWGCKMNTVYIPSHMTHLTLLQYLLSNNCGNNDSKSYCNAILDSDLFIIEGVSNLVAAYLTDSSLVSAPKNITFYRNRYLPLANKLIISRLSVTNLKNFEGNDVKAYVFDKGKFDDHPDYSYSGYTNANKYPTIKNITKVKGNGWDISHARRYVSVFESLYETRDILNLKFPDSTDMSKFANQFIYKIFNNNFDYPLFSNFYDGSNGWFRVGYSNRRNFGYGPYDMSMSAITGGYGIWSKYNSDMQLIMISLYNMIHSTDSTVKIHLNNHYEKYVWTNNKITNKPQREQAYYFEFDSISSLNLATQNALISFYPSICFNENFENYPLQRTENVIVYPYPTSDILYISSRNKITEIYISDILGNKILSKKYNEVFIKLDVSKYSKGFYFLAVKTSEGIILKKVILI